MSVTHAQLETSERASGRSAVGLFPIVAAAILLLFLAAPWPLAHKAHVALHGLCAQRPSHSFRLGETLLPFDARMTGIYGGFLVSAVYLLARGRHRAAALPSWLGSGILVAFVGAMAVDGFNSFLLDMRTWHAYQPDNRLRVLTGGMTGVALAAAIFFLLGLTLWRRPQLDRPVIARPWEPFALLALAAPVGLAALSGFGWLFVPLTIFLLVSATIVVSAIMLVVVVLARRVDNAFSSARELDGHGVVALLLGLVVIAGVAGVRFLLEALTGAPPLT